MNWPMIVRAGYPCWVDQYGETAVCFVGRGPEATVPELIERVVPSPRHGVWLRQVHGARVVPASVDRREDEGDALISAGTAADARLALAVVTADCVPVVLAGVGARAAVHAGWRGIVAGVITAAARAFPTPPTQAWIGPTIGACCYEVGDDVAARVADASTPDVVRPGADVRPHLDLVTAARHQLQAAGVETIRSVGVCTRCHPETLRSYRRDGPGAGRNVALAWAR